MYSTAPIRLLLVGLYKTHPKNPVGVILCPCPACPCTFAHLGWFGELVLDVAIGVNVHAQLALGIGQADGAACGLFGC
jgi:hypothetical protein